MTRIDSGCTAQVYTGVGGQPFFFNTGPKAKPLLVHYIRMNPHENTWAPFLTNSRLFLAEPRRRTVRLMPNKSITFSFGARRFRPPSFMAGTIRDYANTAGGERDEYRRCELPGRSSNLGWIPTPLSGYVQAPQGPNDPDTGVSVGLGPGIWRIVSPTLAMMFEVDQFGGIVVPSSAGAGSLEPPIFPSNGSTVEFTSPVIRRMEHCTVRLKGMEPTVLAQSPEGSYSGVGHIWFPRPWNLGTGFTTTPNAIELFVPPLMNSQTTTAGYAPLYRDSYFASNWVPVVVPLDIDHATVPQEPVLPIPPASSDSP